ncbi:MAG: 2OG-Fe(II) oxygenase [Geminicoccaceae bacterium]|jgi:hypothetical protein|nr:2OG-Fe(II) oxygenase [Geminicoccaceae bacterium]MCB9966583.1 2OG-Fe(II) oxygenase [Geminicoccaceae bacterium]
MAQAIARATNSLSPVPPPFDYARLAATERRDDPFPHVLVENFVTVPDRAALISDFPAITGPGNVEPGDVPQGPAFDRLILELESDRFRAAIADKFGIDLSNAVPTIGIRAFAEPTDGRIHCDHRSKLITLLLYFNEEWTDEGGRLRICRDQSDIEDFATEVVPLSGTLIAFRNGPTAWHGHKQHVGQRRMLQLSFRDMSGIVGIERRLSRLTKPIRRMLNLS